MAPLHQIPAHGFLFRGRIWKLKENIALQKTLAPLPDLEFNLDYDFAIRHDPIQSDD